jgi:glycosyltransferase involved in cell wall biosynthesis
MAAGVPIISTPTRFSRSCMTEGVHVVYNRPGDVAGLAENILKLCGDTKLRQQMSAANRKLALECFSTDCVAQEYVDVYRKVLNGGQATRV